MNRTRHYIQSLLLMLILMGGGIHEAWADKTVTYHVITLPFGNDSLTGGDDDAHKYRIEAIRIKVTCADDAKIELPSKFKSPLMTDDAYTYYYKGNGGVTESEAQQIFPQNSFLKYYTYTIDVANAIDVENTKLDGLGGATDIYVTYDKWNTIEGGKYIYRTDFGNFYKLDGSELYNIEFVYKDKGNEKHEFFAMNMDEPRGNRAQGIPFEYIKSPFDLSYDGPHKLIDGKTDETKTLFHYTWILLNNDPYNIILETAYAKDSADWGPFTYDEKGYKKKSKHARFYGKVKSNTEVEANSWMNNEWGYGWPSGNSGTPDEVPGWFRGDERYGMGGNGIYEKGFYFSFALLDRIDHDNADNTDFTLMAVCSNTAAATNGTWWVPNGSEHYLHLTRNTGKYPGPYYTTFANADRIILHNIKKFTYKVKTPFYKDDDPNKEEHVLQSSIWLSEHYDPYDPLDFVPDDLKRKYVTFEGAYLDDSFAEAKRITKFEDVGKHGGEIWLKYTTTMPFETGTEATGFSELKWYNIVADKNTNYTLWYDTSNGPLSTHVGHAKYGHDSHFAFIGDPYELYLVSRQAGEGDGNAIRYLKRASKETDRLEIFTYTAVTNGTPLTRGETYYTSAIGAGKFTSDGTEVANGTNYFTRDTYSSYTYIAVPNGTTLTAGQTYYTSDKGAGEFSAVGSEVSNGTNYFTRHVGINWEIAYDDESDCFRLRKYGSYANPVYIGWQKSGTYPLKGDAEAVRLYKEDLPLMTYTYYIVNKAGEVAVKASAEQVTGSLLSYESIPEVIRSPFLRGSTLKFYNSNSTDYNKEAGNHQVTRIYYTNSDQGSENEYKNHIFVYYEDLVPAYTALINNVEYNVILNNDYIYYEDGSIKSNPSLIGTSTDPENIWILGGADPYAMTIKNKAPNKFIRVPDADDDDDTEPDWDKGNVDWSDDAPASKYIIKAGTLPNTYEVMMATGMSVDASKTYYNIGRTSNTSVNIYSDDEYEHGYQQIMFQLKTSSARRITYHLIDKANEVLLSETARQARDEKPQIPAEYFCPLVEKYTYWKEDPRPDFNVSNAYYDDGNDEIVSNEEKFSAVFTEDEWVYNALNSEAYKENIEVWITYTTSDEVDLSHTTMYVIKFQQGDAFNQEDGSDGMTKNKIQAVYPYCNGDGNLNIYGQEQYDQQQEGAASTRTRWAWYLQSSGDDDPYHVRILTRQTETYNGLDRSGYLTTTKFDGYDQVVTALVWPNISGVQSCDYMVLGSDHQYQLVTTYPMDEDGNLTADQDPTGKRYVVDSFEQYWKTYDTVKKKLLADLLDQCDVKERTDRTDGSIEVPEVPASLRERLKGTYGFHSYQKMAYAKRWNGYNAAGEKKKGWETLEHWFQTVKMGSGYFDLIPTTIDPALILLDQHGWEIMRKPLPSGPDDPEKEKKYDVLRQYDSPMVKEYIFWASAKKRSGYHQYYLLDQRIGGDFTSTSLTSLPPYDSENVKDSKGNLVDQYVTYIVKEEYTKSYVPGTTPTAYPFLIRQGNELAKKGAEDNKVAVAGHAGVSQYIIEHIASLEDNADELWYVKPNTDIDIEMGYPATHPDWKDNPNAYEDEVFRNYPTAQLIEGTSSDATVKKYGYFTFSNGFDPYNIQISSTGTGTQYFTLGMSGAEVNGGSINGIYASESEKAVTLKAKNTTPVSGSSYDSKFFAMTNQTFMAVQDKDGNMQLMPRFDHQNRLQAFVQLVTPESSSAEPDKLEKTYTQLYRPYVYNYLIVDNSGHESLRYRSGGDLLPQTAGHLKSPLAKDFKYYSGLTSSAGVYDLTNIAKKEIKASLAGAGLTTPEVSNSNLVYVRYAYDEEADVQDILKGKWLTMQLNAKDAIYDSGIKQATASKPSPVTGTTDRLWQWKFLKYPYSDPDPYAVQVFNRLSDNQDNPMSVADDPMIGGTLTAQTDGASGYHQHFALLAHSDLNSDGKPDTYALALARTGLYTYPFLNGNTMTTSTAAIIQEDKTDYVDPQAPSGFSSTSNVFHATDTRVQLFDDVINKYTYKVYTNDRLTQAITAEQTHYEAIDNNFDPTLPEEARSPLLNLEQYRYYEKSADMDIASKQLAKLYGLYGNEVYVRYTYDPTKSSYKVPNERNDVSAAQVARGEHSNDSPLKFGEKMLYNFVWYDDNIMKSNSGHTAVESVENHELEYTEKDFEWQLYGDDPYAIQIKNRGSIDKYISSDGSLQTTPQTFMLLSKSGYDYGVLAKTGDKDKMLSLDGSTLSTDATSPNHFIIFALSTLKVVYHLAIANIGDDVVIPYRKGARAPKDDPGYDWIEGKEKGYSVGYDADKDTVHIMGTTKRDLTSKYQLGSTIFYPDLAGTLENTTYCYDFGPVSLGDGLKVPDVFYRPNVVYTFVIHHINNDALNNKYKGMEIKSKEMGLDEDLIGKTIYIDLVYSFDGDLTSNNGDNFVLSLDENKWYTLETVVNGTPWLAQYTNAWGFELKEGYGSHYTNDFLWSPIGDPYGFQLFNRYMDINSGNDNRGEANKVITTEDFRDSEASVSKETATDAGKTRIQPLPSGDKIDGATVFMGDYVDVSGTKNSVIPGKDAHVVPQADILNNSIYELLDDGTPGYFIFHPVANTEETKYYLNPVRGKDADGAEHLYMRLTQNKAEITFGLNKDLLKPYFDRAGYVGGLKKEVYNANPELVAAMKDGAAYTANQLRSAQTLVYNFDNTVPFATGYYRLHSPLGISDIDPVRYVSGYTHKIEYDTNGSGAEDSYDNPIPMHFYEEDSERVRNFTDLKDGGFTESHATRGDLDILPVERDPASIFYFEAIYDHPESPKKPSDPEVDNPDYRNNLSYVSTQGLYVRGTVAKGVDETAKNSWFNGTMNRAAAVMTNHALPSNPVYPAEADPTPLFIMDIGGGILLIHDNKTEGGRLKLKYFCYDHSYDEDNKPTVFDMKMTHNTHTDHAKFCMQPVQNTATKGVNEMPLKLKMNKGGDGYYYASFYAPYDVLLTDATNDAAFICLVWDTEMLHLKKVGKYNAAPYKGNNQFVPANTPVIIRSTNTTVSMALPTTKPTTALTQGIFKGELLEQLLAEENTGNDASNNDVYTFGLPYKGTVTKHNDYYNSGTNNGRITLSLAQTEESGVGFYINANPNREGGGAMGLWIPNNRYVYSNKIYIRNPSVSPARRGNMTDEVTFVPVVFDEGDEEDDDPIEERSSRQQCYDNRVFDLQGRCVASEQQVAEGNWRKHLHPGIYILNGKKVRVGMR